MGCFLAFLTTLMLAVHVHSVEQTQTQTSSNGYGDDGKVSHNFETMRSFLVEAGVTSKDTLGNDASAQYNALMWLADHDQAKLSVPPPSLLSSSSSSSSTGTKTTTTTAATTFATAADATSNNHSFRYRLIQRYVMTVLYVSGFGNDWQYNDFWLSGEHECQWQYVECLGTEEQHGEVGKNVTELNLFANNIVGTVPSELGFLERLGK